jgi:hypothetical protein
MTTEGDGSGLPAGIPTFPLNTDGIDVAGVNITVQHCRIQNFDDSVCLKPSHMGTAMTPLSDSVLAALFLASHDFRRYVWRLHRKCAV